MDMRILMSYVYPVFASSLFVLFVLEILRYMIVRHEMPQGIRIVFVIPLFCAIMLLTLTTGTAPRLDIDVLRPYIVYSRIAGAIMTNVLNAYLVYELVRVVVQRRKH